MNNDKPLDCLTELLRNYGHHSFSIKHEFEFIDTGEYFEKWASHILMGTSHPITNDEGLSLDKRDFNGAIQCFSNYRKAERSWVNTAVYDQRDVLWLVMKELDQLVQQGKESDKRIIKEFETLLGSVKSADPNEMKQAVEQSVSIIIKELTDRENRAKEGLDEMTEKVQALEEQLTVTKEKAEIDPLTQVYTRGTFDEKLNETVSEFARKGSPACLFFIDVDNFKNVNDSYGHQVGDEVLKQIANTCISFLKRKGDIVARYGGDEFAAIMPDASLEDAIIVGKKIVKAISEIKYDIENLVSTVSVGVSEMTPEDNAESWLKKSDRAVYLAKEDGRNNLKSV